VGRETYSPVYTPQGGWKGGIWPSIHPSEAREEVYPVYTPLREARRRFTPVIGSSGRLGGRFNTVICSSGRLGGEV